MISIHCIMSVCCRDARVIRVCTVAVVLVGGLLCISWVDGQFSIVMGNTSIGAQSHVWICSQNTNCRMVACADYCHATLF